MSKSKSSYRAANGTKIKNHGKRSLVAYTDHWTPIRMDAQVADVSTPLASVYQMCKSGNKVIFTEEGGVIINKGTGQKLPIAQRNGAYEINMCAGKDRERKDDQKSMEIHQATRNASEDQIDMDFIRQG